MKKHILAQGGKPLEVTIITMGRSIFRPGSMREPNAVESIDGVRGAPV